ncbi:probable receptor-like protein kinase At1g30570 [Cucurbita maxima]|uniref:Probable receptor-like protein kinase At1g30570 n=1 Tax=Cucurbita maxima TaxID=3661 RepID=A0A6J1KX41_CUCMA|nr:probable receptor-like protein kinase At1g30570 [Cucurbita maxima]
MGKFLILSLLLMIISGCVQTGESNSNSIFIDCGSTSNETVDGRKWIGDLSSEGNFSVGNLGANINASTATLNGDSVFEPLYKTARLFTNSLNYTFKGVWGNHFVRLHFCPFPFENLNVNESSFSVSANGLRLVSELNVPNEIAYKNLEFQRSGINSSWFSLIKEFIIVVNSEAFVLEFSPSGGSFGFINAIEIVPLVDELFAGSINKVGGNAVSLNVSERGSETMYRLNVGGPEIKPAQDSNGWRMWEVDSSYMITADAGFEIHNSSNITYASMNDSIVAPLPVYETARTMSETEVLEKRFNMSWKFEVHPGFEYLIRLHFCELLYEKARQRVFKIYINNRTAFENFDVFDRAGGINKAYHVDFLEPISSKINTLWIQLGPDTAAGAAGTDALLNGLEIFKLSQNGNLAYIDRFNALEESMGNSKSLTLWIGVGAGLASVVFLAVITILIIYFCRFRREDFTKKSCSRWRAGSSRGATVSNTYARGSLGGGQSVFGSMPTIRVGKWFTLAEILAATDKFDEALLIGVGGFGKVYRGEIDDGTLVAIKRANPQSQQGLTEFETEIEMLSKLRHRHLVSMIGFCDEQKEMILVYEYMGNGTLRSHLFGSDLPPLTWKQRLEVCIGAARGLHYLHTGAERGIIHRDVKTTNILLDENFVAKMSDFGLSKTGPALDHTHVSTAVKGSFGYLDPEYFRRQQLSEKSDVYSFGVVLLEVVCARAVINPTLPKDQINLAEWAMKWQRKKLLHTIIDPRLNDKYCPESLKTFGEIAEKCLADEGKIRPTMGEVLWHLEYALQLHDAWIRTNEAESSCRVESEGAQADEQIGESSNLKASTPTDHLC